MTQFKSNYSFRRKGQCLLKGEEVDKSDSSLEKSKGSSQTKDNVTLLTSRRRRASSLKNLQQMSEQSFQSNIHSRKFSVQSFQLELQKFPVESS